jgi:hypothetical protein
MYTYVKQNSALLCRLFRCSSYILQANYSSSTQESHREIMWNIIDRSPRICGITTNLAVYVSPNIAVRSCNFYISSANVTTW